MTGALGDTPIVGHNGKKIGTLNQPAILTRSDLVAFFHSTFEFPSLDATGSTPKPSNGRHIGAALVDIGSPPLSRTDSSNACIGVTPLSPAEGQWRNFPDESRLWHSQNPCPS